VAHLAVSWYTAERDALRVADPARLDPWDDGRLRVLAERALSGEDAHRVKYLVCLRRAVATDPEGGPIYAAAGRRLDAWWEERLRA
jgi:hypothetical protein